MQELNLLDWHPLLNDFFNVGLFLGGPNFKCLSFGAAMSAGAIGFMTYRRKGTLRFRLSLT